MEYLTNFVAFKFAKQNKRKSHSHDMVMILRESTQNIIDK